MEKARILIVEDDKNIIKGLKHNLEFEGYKVSTAEDGKTGCELALKNKYHLLLLDIMLPELNGYDVCRRIRKEKPDLPIIMLTARGEEVDKVAGLDLGADDYITKPFSVPELLARIRALLRRYDTIKIENQFTFGNVVLNFKKFEATVNGKAVHLSAREFAILKFMIERANQVVHRHDLLDHVWGYNNFPTTRTVDTHILELRKKLEPVPSLPRHILSVRGVGYKFIP